MGELIFRKEGCERKCYTCGNASTDDNCKLHCKRKDDSNSKVVDEDDTCDNWN